MQARIDKESYHQALSESPPRLTLSEAGLEESQEEPFATFQPQGVLLDSLTPLGSGCIGRHQTSAMSWWSMSATDARFNIGQILFCVHSM